MSVGQMSLLDWPAHADVAHLDRVMAERSLHHTGARTLARVRCGQGQPIDPLEAESLLRHDRPYLAELEACIAELDAKCPEFPELEAMRWGARTLRAAVAALDRIVAGAAPFPEIHAARERRAA